MGGWGKKGGKAGDKDGGKGWDSGKGWGCGGGAWGSDKGGWEHWAGKAGKGKKPPSWDAWEEPAGEGEGIEKTGRIWSRYQLSKKILRASANTDGSCFWKEGHRKISDQKFLAKESLKEAMTAESSHLVRRPGVGLSETMGSVSVGLEVLDASKEVDFDGLRKLFKDTGPDLTEAMRFLNKANEMERSKADTEKHLAVVMQFFQENKRELHELATNATVAAGRLYLAGTSLLQLCTAMGNPAWWSERMPSSLDHKAVQAWRDSPKDKAKMRKALAQLFVQKIEEDAAYGAESNDAKSVFKRPTAEGASADSDDEDPKKTTKKKQQKRKRASSSAASSGSEEKKQKKNKKKARVAAEKKKKGKRKSESSEHADSDAAAAKKQEKKKAALKAKDKKKSQKSTSTSSSSESEDRGPKGPSKKPDVPTAESEAAVKKIAAFAEWTLGCVQEASALSAQTTEAIGSNAGGVFPVRDVRKLSEAIPEVVLSLFPIAQEIQQFGADAPLENTIAKRVVQELTSITEEAQAFYEQQAGASGGSSRK